jgi:ribonuclease-3
MVVVYNMAELADQDGHRFSAKSKLLQLSDAVNMIARYVPGVDVSGVSLDVYRQAMTHRSYCTRFTKAANAACPRDCVPLQERSNERLEFLGDSVLSLIVTSYLFERYPNENEGFMTRMRTKLVNGNMLANLCQAGTRLPEFVIVRPPSSGPAAGTNKQSQRILEDVFEAFLGALFIDLGFEVARRWLVGLLEEHVNFAHLVAHQNNPKDVLHRYFVARHGYTPSYEDAVSSSSDAVLVSVIVRDRDGCVIATGVGNTRRAAEDDAAKNAVHYLGIL